MRLNSRSDLTPAMVHELFYYDPSRGVITNRVDRGTRARAGDVAGSIGADGHRRIIVGKISFLASRIAFVYMRGRWPKKLIDHRNKNASDDAWCNLREATRSQNNTNRRRGYNLNACGFRGVQRRPSGRFVVYIAAGRKTHYIGSYTNAQYAALAYDMEAKKLHGEFAQLNFPHSAHRDWLVP